MPDVLEDRPLILKPTSSVVEARRARRQAILVASWLQGVWGGADLMPAFSWNTLLALPAWALGTPAQLERLALLTGTLFAAPALRKCLDAGPLLRVRGLIGAVALDSVLALPDDPMPSPEWPQDERSERDTLQAWGGAMLSASVPDPLLQTSLVRTLRLSAALVRRGLPPLPLAERMTRQALAIAASSSLEPSVVAGSEGGWA